MYDGLAHFMNASDIRQQIAAAIKAKGKVDAATVDQIMEEVRKEGWLTPDERAELLKSVDGFDEAGRNRLRQYLASEDKARAHVNVAGVSASTAISGRYERVESSVPGMMVDVGLFDSAISLSGTAVGPGVLQLSVDGKTLSVPVQTRETPTVVLQRLESQLPAGVEGALLDGSAQPFGPADVSSPDETAAHILLFRPAALGLRPGEKPLRVVVTGYGNFMGVMNNPSDLMAAKLARMGIEGAMIEYWRLDVTTEAVEGFIREMKAHPPDVILSMGMGGESQIEELPENRIDGGTDGAGNQLPVGKIDPVGPDTERVRLPLPQINTALDLGFGKARVVGSSASNPKYAPDRSAYLCNYLGYRLAETFDGTRTAAGFVHVTSSTPAAQMHTLLEAVAARQRDLQRQTPPP